MSRTSDTLRACFRASCRSLYVCARAIRGRESPSTRETRRKMRFSLSRSTHSPSLAGVPLARRAQKKAVRARAVLSISATGFLSARRNAVSCLSETTEYGRVDSAKIMNYAPRRFASVYRRNVCTRCVSRLIRRGFHSPAIDSQPHRATLDRSASC